MNNHDQELEIKLLVRDLKAIEDRLMSLGAKLKQARVLEINLRFDTTQKELSRTYKALRLRKDNQLRLTYKGPSETREGVRVRQEIEFTVSDFEAARDFLEALGYQVFMVYEKYRTEYDYHGVSISLDELPYGYFVEIEGPDPVSIRKVNQDLSLNWEGRITESYLMIFNQISQKAGLTYRDLTFELFQERDLAERVLGFIPADLEV
jgi:adenylate cyclase, class 2